MEDSATTSAPEGESTDAGMEFDPGIFGLDGVSDADLGGPEADPKDDSTEDDSVKDDSTEDDSVKDGSTEDDSVKDDSTEDDSVKDDSTEDDSVKDDSTKDDSTKDDSVKDDSTKDDSTKEDPKKSSVPEGHVPLAALHQARGEITRLKGELSAVRAQKSEPQSERLVTAKESEEFKDFSVVTKAKLAERFEDDPVGAAEYTDKLGKYYDFKNRESRQKTLDEQSAKDQEAHEAALVEEYDRASGEMEEVLPGLFSNDEVQEGITTFAESLGFGENLFFLTNPTTQVILPGGDTPVPLGARAAAMLRTLVTARTKLTESKPVDTKALETKIRVEVEKEIRGELEKEYLAKVKAHARGDKYTSLDDVPTADADRALSGKVLSENDISRLSPAALEEYLKGN